MADVIKLKDDTGAITEYTDVSVVHLPTNDEGTVFAEFREGADKSLVTITDTSAKTISPDDASHYMKSVQVQVDATNLSSINIVKGVSILGVPGGYERGGEVVPTVKKLTGTISSNGPYVSYPSSKGADYYNAVELNIDVDIPSVVEEYPSAGVTDIPTFRANETYNITVPNNQSGDKRYAHKVRFKVDVPQTGGGEITPVSAQPTYYRIGQQEAIFPGDNELFSEIRATVNVPVIENYVYQQTITDNGTHEISIPNAPITGVGDVPQYAHKISLDVNVPSGGKWPTPTVRVAGSVASTDPVAGVTKYMLYVNGRKRGYLDQNGTWHPINT